MAVAMDDRCTRHPGRLVDMFCGNHDVVCCTGCVAAFHRSCPFTMYISDAARGVVGGAEYQDTISDVSGMLARLGAIKEQRHNDILRLEKERDAALKLVSDIRTNVNAFLDTLENNSKEDIKSRFSKDAATVKHDVQTVDGIISSLTKSIKNLEAKVGGESQVFANMKRAKVCVADTDRLQSVVNLRIGEERIKFDPDIKQLNGLLTWKSLGQLRCWPRVYKASYMGQHDLHTERDKHNCHVSGIVKLPSGETLVTDWNNKSLKLFDEYFNFIESLSLSSEPSDICCVAAKEVAVSLIYQQKIQLVSLANGMKRTEKLTVEGYCRGLAYHTGQLFLTCWLNEKDEPRILVYSMSGKKLRVIDRNPSGEKQFSELSRIALSVDGTRIYVTDADHGVVILNRNGDVISPVSANGGSYPVGVSTDNTGQAFVCYKYSHRVAQIGPAGECVGLVATQQEGVKKPTCICYDVTNCRILVGYFENELLQVFNLSF